MGAMLAITGEQRSKLRERVNSCINDINGTLVGVIQEALHYYQPPSEIAELISQISNLHNEVSKAPVDGPIELVADVVA